MSPAEPRRPGLVGSATQLLFRQATRLPLTAVSMGLQAWEGSRGLRDTARRHGAEVLQIAAHTPLGRFLPKEVLDDGAEEEAARIVQDARNNVLSTIDAGKAEVAGSATGTVRAATRGAAKAPKAAREAGAPGVAAPVAEKISEQLDIDEPSRDELPIPDFDNVSLGSLRGRLRSLSLEQLVVLREWEQAHAHRLPVMTLLDNRIAKLGAEQQSSSGSSAYPSEAAEAERAAEEEGGTLRV